MILLVTRCLARLRGTHRQRPALAGIRSRRELRQAADGLVVRQRLLCLLLDRVAHKAAGARVDADYPRDEHVRVRP